MVRTLDGLIAMLRSGSRCAETDGLGDDHVATAPRFMDSESPDAGAARRDGEEPEGLRKRSLTRYRG
jgi:hypothetical protein